MPAPFPYNAVAGTANDPAEQEAGNVYSNYAWLARLADEMDSDQQLDLKRCMQIVAHARRFKKHYDNIKARGEAAYDALEGAFGLRKVWWDSPAQMVADLDAIATDAVALADWIDANEGNYKRGFARTIVVGFDANIGAPTLSDEPIKADKKPATAKRIAAFRARFGARPS